MLNIRRDTIIKKGDILVSADEKSKLKVKEMVGFKIHVFDPVSNQEKIVLKNDLLINNWKIIVNDRGYW